MKMKKRFFFLLISGVFFCTSAAWAQDNNDLVSLCVNDASNEATYLKDYVVKLPSAQPGARKPVAKNTILLLKNTHYRFTICSSDKYNGEGILQLFDTKRLIASTFDPNTGKNYKSIDFFCKKSGPYTIYISFKDGKEGMAVGILSYVKN